MRLGAEALAKKVRVRVRVRVRVSPNPHPNPNPYPNPNQLSNLDDELFVVIVACPAGKHDTASKKVAKYGSGSKVIAAWADKAAC